MKPTLTGHTKIRKYDSLGYYIVSRLGSSIDTFMATSMNKTDLFGHRSRGFWTR